ncbi:hypothetical protein GCM10025792_38330 [Pseudonocardia tropica]|uniref:Uncharacterized protein n=1 Tax=Microbacterium yannicii TaxID=671622 RepID=A0ABP9MTG3_9MICO
MKLGKAIINKITAGNIVQIISIVCPCLIYLYAIGFFEYVLTIVNNIHDTKPKIINK